MGPWEEGVGLPPRVPSPNQALSLLDLPVEELERELSPEVQQEQGPPPF